MERNVEYPAKTEEIFIAGEFRGLLAILLSTKELTKENLQAILRKYKSAVEYANPEKKDQVGKIMRMIGEYLGSIALCRSLDESSVEAEFQELRQIAQKILARYKIGVATTTLA